jgi:hypothetical protein
MSAPPDDDEVVTAGLQSAREFERAKAAIATVDIANAPRGGSR